MSEKLTNKTCGECKHFEVDVVAATCEKKLWICDDNTPACKKFQSKVITNGDRIRQMSNEEYAEEFGSEIVILKDFDGNPFKAYAPLSGELCETRAEAKNKSLAWLNAPAEINTESEGEDE